jgi:NAD(P)H-flavin reductase
MTNPYVPHIAVLKKIVTENAVNDIKTFEVKFEDLEVARNFDYKPGQFGMVSYFGAGECPIGIASSPTDEGSIEFTIKKVGVVTTALHNSMVGDKIGVRGPYGNGWPVEAMEGHNVLIVGAGFAFTTLRSLAKYILNEDNRGRFGDLTVLYGARNPGELIYKYDLSEWENSDDIDLILTVDRGDESWTKRVGYVPTILEEASPSSENAVAVICGPPIVIRLSMPILTKLGFTPEKTYLSLEMRMKCGIGKCGRCNVGDKFVCQDGPVFSQKELQEMPKEY